MHTFVQIGNELLRKHGYRLTPQRYLILSVIQEANEHLSIEQITARVQQHNPSVNLSTVYRTLELLQSLGLVRAVHLPGEQHYYENATNHAHHHLVCRRCHTTLHLDENLLGNLHEDLQRAYQYHNLSLELTVTGYCDSCWKALQQERLIETSGT